MSTFIPLGTRILVEPRIEEANTTTSSGIIVENTASKATYSTGTIKSVAAEIGKEFKAGTTIIYAKYGYDEVEVDGVKYHIVNSQDVIGEIHE